MVEAKALLRFSSLHGRSDTDVRAFSADVRQAVRDSMESLRSAAALSNPSTRAPSLDNSHTVRALKLLPVLYILSATACLAKLLELLQSLYVRHWVHR